MSYTFVSESPLKHTYPYGRHDVEIPFGTVDELSAALKEVYGDVPDCRRVIISIAQGDSDAAAICEEAGFRYAIDVQTREGNELSLMIHEPSWVAEQSTDITDLELS